VPELPEVETTRLHVEKIFRGKRLLTVTPDLDDTIVFNEASPEEVKIALEGSKVIGTGRKGKYFWLELDRRPWPIFHLGMTGNIETRVGKKDFERAWGGEKLWSEPKKETAKTRFIPFCRLRVVAENGAEFVFTDPRRFGRIRLTLDPAQDASISKLGFDPLHNFPDAHRLFEILRKRKAPLKSVLLDQKVFAGVGNWIADEVLFQAALSPHRLCVSLSEKEVSVMRLKILSIIKKSVAVQANYDLYPRSWLFHHRWGKEKGAKTSKNLSIQFDTVGGRTTAWVPESQK
jgi:formamidopyrimidine-DNA glycosylase